MMRHDGMMCEEFVNSIQVLSVYSVCFLEKCPQLSQSHDRVMTVHRTLKCDAHSFFFGNDFRMTSE